MHFQDLKEAIARLDNDPRVHPNTRIDLHVDVDVGVDDRADIIHELRPLCSIALHNGSLRLSAHATRQAVAR